MAVDPDIITLADIQGAKENICFLEEWVETNDLTIDTPDGKTVLSLAGISSNSQVAVNAANIIINAGDISDNADAIVINASDISDNADDISDNAIAIAALGGGFAGANIDRQIGTVGNLTFLVDAKVEANGVGSVVVSDSTKVPGGVLVSRLSLGKYLVSPSIGALPNPYTGGRWVVTPKDEAHSILVVSVTSSGLGAAPEITYEVRKKTDGALVDDDSHCITSGII